MSTWKLIEEDFDRHSHAKGIVRYIRMLIALLGNPSFMTTFWFRLASSTLPPPHCIFMQCSIQVYINCHWNSNITSYSNRFWTQIPSPWDYCYKSLFYNR